MDTHTEPILSETHRPSQSQAHTDMQTNAGTERHKDKQTDITHKHSATDRQHEVMHKRVHRETHKHMQEMMSDTNTHKCRRAS